MSPCRLYRPINGSCAPGSVGVGGQHVVTLHRVGILQRQGARIAVQSGSVETVGWNVVEMILLDPCSAFVQCPTTSLTITGRFWIFPERGFFLGFWHDAEITRRLEVIRCLAMKNVCPDY